ncbi:GNAT family N-acetyltransferase [Salmonella enterica subsp. enterica serovar Typhimurium]|nr:GNAT family N-acetyltransferase [Salmonella enterica subsp. enterica serovar Typhimurium]
MNLFSELFFQTVHTVNTKDYIKEQLNVWATGNVDLSVWNNSFLEHYTLVALENNVIVGFGDIDNTGYLDRLFVHKDYQSQGIATALCDRLEAGFDRVTTHASITAKQFFMNRGYRLIKEQQVVRNGISLANYVMEK